MIFFATPAQGAGTPIAAVFEHSISSRTFQTAAAAGTPPIEPFAVGDVANSAELQPDRQDVHEEFDWSSTKIQREFIRLEQKVIARKGTADEQRRYLAMKRGRNSRIFADRYVRDYAEIQRIRRLSKKLAEIQRDLRPISI
jgi:hypothetical protein